MKDIKKYQGYGWYLVPCHHNQKKPIKKDWGNIKNCISPDEKYVKTDINIAIAHAYSRTCSIDLDDLKKARTWFYKRQINIDTYLDDPKNVKIVSGRDNKAKLLFALPPNQELLPHVKRDADGFELRCANRKGVTIKDMLPPSIHPDTKQPYTWKGDPSKLTVLPQKIAKIWYSFIRDAKAHAPVENAEDIMPFINDAITRIDPDIEYNDWVMIGMALHAVGPDLLDIWEDWSAAGSKYQSGDCESRWMGFEQDGGLSVASFFKYAYATGWEPINALKKIILNWKGTNTELVSKAAALSYHLNVNPMVMDEIFKDIKKVTKVSITAIRKTFDQEIKRIDEVVSEYLDYTHAEISDLFIADLNEEFPPKVIVSQGHLWMYKDEYYQSMSPDDIAGAVGRKYADQKLCKTGSAYKQIASYAVSTDQKPFYFIKAPEGVATKKGFYYIEDGEVKREHNSPDHRQRWLIPVIPKKGEKPLFDGLLKNALGHDPGQMDLLQEVFGAIMFNKLSISYQKAIIFYGQTDTGKSVLIDILRSLFPEDRTTTVSPDKFKSDYNLALLATSALNTYEELPDAKSISSPEFKALVAGGRMLGRPIYGKPIEYRARASHVFSSNFLPTTNEITDAFFNRWILFDFKNPVKKKDIDLMNKIVKDELSSIFYWALMGMKRLIANDNKFSISSSHEHLMTRWTRTSNIVLEFLHDTDWIQIDHEDTKKKSLKSELFYCFRDWCRYHDRKATQKGEFNHRVMQYLKIEEAWKLDGNEIWRGIAINFDLPKH